MKQEHNGLEKKLTKLMDKYSMDANVPILASFIQNLLDNQKKQLVEKIERMKELSNAFPMVRFVGTKEIVQEYNEGYRGAMDAVLSILQDK